MSSFNEENNTQINYWQVLRNHWGIILITLVMCVVTAFVITTLMTPVYSTYTRFQVNQDDYTTSSAQAGGLRKMPDRNFFETQRISIQSFETLKLADGWQKEEKGKEGKNLRLFTKDLGKDYEAAIERLSGMLTVDIEIGSNMFKITTYHSDKDQAQALAEEVRNAYERRRLLARRKLSTSNDEKLMADLESAKDERDRLYGELVKRASDANLPFVAEDMVNHENQAKKEYDSKSSQLTQQEDEIKRYEQFASDFEQKTDAQIISFLMSEPAMVKRPIVLKIHEEVNELQKQRADALLEGYGENHRVIKSIDGQLVTAKQKLTSEIADARTEVKNTLSDKQKQKEITEDLRSKLAKKHKTENENFNKHRRLIREHGIAEDKYLALGEQMKAVKDSYDYYNEPIILENPAKTPQAAISPNVPLIMGIGTAAGLVFGLAIAFLIELMDTSVKTLEDVEKYLQVPVLAVVPQDVGLLHEQDGVSPDAEAYRILRTNIEFNRKRAENNALTVVSGGAGEGKSTTLLNLAYICAQGGYTTLVIDADLRRPRLHTYLGVENKIGLSNYLTTDASLENVVVKTNIENLFFMASGILPQDAAGVLNSRRMTEMVKEVKSRFDLVLVDSPPILGVSDASVISSEVDYTMIVIQHRKLPRKLLLRVKQAVENVGGNIIGVVLNNVDVQSDTEYQYYTSYYTYHSPAAIREAAELAAHQEDSSDTASRSMKSKASASDDDLY